MSAEPPSSSPFPGLHSSRLRAPQQVWRQQSPSCPAEFNLPLVRDGKSQYWERFCLNRGAFLPRLGLPWSEQSAVRITGCQAGNLEGLGPVVEGNGCNGPDLSRALVCVSWGCSASGIVLGCCWVETRLSKPSR